MAGVILTETQQIYHKLSWPFSPKLVKWRIGPTNKKKVNDGNASGPKPPTRGLPLAYIDARDVMQRLDQIVGFECWQSRMRPGADGLLICELSVKLNGEWITKSDVAGETGEKGGFDKSDSQKGSGSDAFKRAGVHFGIFRYGYSLPSEWVELEPNGNFTSPELPEWATPKGWGAHTGIDLNDRDLSQQEYDDLAASVVAYRKQKGERIVNQALEQMGKSDTSKWTVREWEQFVAKVEPIPDAAAG